MIDFPEGLACKDASPFSKGEESCLWRFFQAIAGFDRNIFSIQKASSRLIVVGHASTPDAGLDVL